MRFPSHNEWRSSRRLAIALALGALSACVGVSYQRRAERITPRSGQTLVFGRLRFFHDGREFFPWGTAVVAPAAGTNTERHVWLLRLSRRAVSAELHPDGDGSLAIWLAPGDYALVGSTQPVQPPSAALEVIALLRVPAGAVASYPGELSFRTQTREGAHVSYGEFGATSVDVPPTDVARAALERRLGVLPEPPVVSPFCAGDALPAFDDPNLASRARALLDRGCRMDSGVGQR